MPPFKRQIHAVGMSVMDDLSERFEEADELFGGAAAKLARKWRKMDSEEKQYAVELLVGAVTATAAAIAAIAKKKSAKKKSAKQIGRNTVAQLASIAVDATADLKKKAKKMKK